MRAWFIVTLLVLTACQSTEAPKAVAEGQGKGLIAFDPTPPAGAKTWPQPEWHKGDHYVLVRGGQEKMAFTVSEVGERGYVLTDIAGNQYLRGKDLSNLGERPRGSDHLAHELSPGDVRFHWPLWVGKRWRCHFLDKNANGSALPIEVAYTVEDVDTITVPGGTFEALRILRTSRLVLEGPDKFFDRDSVIWYAPAIGLEVRQFLDETRVELLEWTAGKAP
jgi:hypothetical protein